VKKLLVLLVLAVAAVAATFVGWHTDTSLAGGSGGPFAYVANRSSGDVSVIDLASETEVALIDTGGSPYWVAISADSSVVAVTLGNDTGVALISGTTNTLLGVVDGVGDEPEAVAVDSNGSTAYVADEYYDNLYVVDVTSQMVSGSPVGLSGVSPIDLSGSCSGPENMVISPDDAYLYITCAGSSVIRVATSGFAITSIDTGLSDPHGIALNPAGTFLYYTDGTDVFEWDTVSETLTGTEFDGCDMYGGRISPDGSQLLCQVENGGLKVYDTSDGSLFDSVATDGTAVDVQPSGTRAYVPDGSVVKVVDLAEVKAAGALLPGIDTNGSGGRGIAIGGLVGGVPFQTDKCYQARLAKRSARFQRRNMLTLDFNFEFKTSTTVLGLSLFCSPAVQELDIDGSAAGIRTPEVPLEDIRSICYSSRDSYVHRNENIFVRTKISESVLSVGRAEMVCVLGVKGSGRLPDFGLLDGFILKCYSARLAKGSPRFERVSGSIADQFSEGFKRTTILRPVSFCNAGFKLTDLCKGKCPAGEADTAGEIDPDFNSIVCYGIRQASFRPFNIPVIDQFIDQQFVDPLITIRKADRLCVLAAKKKVAPNDRIELPTTVEMDYCDLGGWGADCFEDHIGTTAAARQTGDPFIRNCEFLGDGFDYGHSVWYTFTPDSDETDVDIDTYGSTYDTILAVYTGSPGNLTQLACNDEALSKIDDWSHLKLHLNVGQKYWILVGAHGSDPGGKLKFHVTSQEVCTC